MPESPRWLEARERRTQARKVVERMETRASRGGRIALAEPDLAPHQVVAEEKTSWLAVFGKNYMLVTILLLVVMVLGYGGIIYGAASQAFLFLSFNRHYSAGVRVRPDRLVRGGPAAVYLINAFFGSGSSAVGSAVRRHLVRRRLVRRLRGAQHHGPGHLVPDRGRRRHLVAVEHVRLHPHQLPDPDARAGHRLDRRRRPPRRLGRRPDRRQLFVIRDPRSWIMFITIPCALVPAVLLAIFGKSQSRRALEEMTQ